MASFRPSAGAPILPTSNSCRSTSQGRNYHVTLGTERMSITPLQGEGGHFPRQDAPTANVKRLVLVAIKALVSIGLIAVLATRLDYTRVLSYWHVLDGIWILGALAILFLEMCLLSGVRLKLVLASVDARRPLTITAQIALCGFFFEQVTIGFVGGDSIRLWLLRRTGVPLGRAIQALVLDRACGLG